VAALVLDDVKFNAGRRTVAIPSPLVDLLLAHRDVQEQERRTAGSGTRKDLISWHPGNVT